MPSNMLINNRTASTLLVGDIIAERAYYGSSEVFIASEDDFDPDAASYIAAVEAADGQALEEGVKQAIDGFVTGCKADGVWDALKASCILAGARTLNGALVPLAGDAPTNFNFVSTDYDRVTGLKGDGSTKYLNSGFVLSDFPADGDASMTVWVTEANPTSSARYAGGRSSSDSSFSPWQIFLTGSSPTDSIRFWLGIGGSSNVEVSNAATETGLVGASRDGDTLRGFAGEKNNFATNFEERDRGNEPVYVFSFALEDGEVQRGSYTASRLSLYTLGGDLDETALSARVSNLMAEIEAELT